MFFKINCFLKIKFFEVIKDFILLQYPDNFFDGIFHVDVFYFWSKQKMFDICDEMYRILKPGKKMICGMDINRYNLLLLKFLCLR